MISYIHHTQNWSQKCWVGDKVEDIKIMLFCDASFAGELKGSKSTSGAVMCLVGPYTFVPLTQFAKKQGAVSHSFTEAEVISFDAAFRMLGLPMLTLLGSRRPKGCQQ